MASISFETGLKTFDINGAVQVQFSPTDMAFIEKVYETLQRMDAKQEEYKAATEKVTDAELFDLARKMDAEAREEINSIFGADICTPVFGTLNVFAIADGFPVWVNLLLAIIDEFDGAFAEEQKKTNPRIQKYTAKYKR